MSVNLNPAILYDEEGLAQILDKVKSAKNMLRVAPQRDLDNVDQRRRALHLAASAALELRDADQLWQHKYLGVTTQALQEFSGGKSRWNIGLELDWAIAYLDLLSAHDPADDRDYVACFCLGFDLVDKVSVKLNTFHDFARRIRHFQVQSALQAAG